MSVKKIQFYFSFLILAGCFFINHSAQALTISPALVKIELNPGETQTQIIKLFNETDQTLSFYSAVENFAPDKTTNAPIFLGNQNILGVARWFNIDQSQIILKSGERGEVAVKISAPRIAEPGGYYAAVLWSDVPPQVGGVKTANRLATLFLLTIKGQINADLQISAFQKKTGVPLGFDLEIENKGNIHLQPTGSVSIINRKGEQVSTLLVNPLKQIILPQSKRSFELVGTDILGWGKFTAEAQISFGQDKILKSQKIVFWVWPEHLIGIVLSFVVIILVVLGVFKIAKSKTASHS